MAKKTLKQKIELVGFWTFGGLFWYLVISFFLLSDYPIYDQPFNHKKAYEVIKDAFGLAAAFLAPVAAFVLFSDWRKEHTEKKLESDTETIVKQLEEILAQLVDFSSVICSGDKNDEKRALDIFKRKFTLEIQINSADRFISRIKEIDDKKAVSKFKENAKEATNLMKSSLDKQYELDNKFQYNTQPYWVSDHIGVKGINNKIDEKLTELNKQLDIFKIRD